MIFNPKSAIGLQGCRYLEKLVVIMIPFVPPEAYRSEEFVACEMNGPIHALSFINSVIVPRPIAFITTFGPGGIVNAAPFSYFNIACTNPPMISVAIERRKGERKDTSRNIMVHKEFVVNICSIELAQAISLAGGDFPPDVSEIELSNLSLLPSEIVSVPRVANTLAQIECKLHQALELGRDPTDLILGEIVKVHLHKKIVGKDGKIEVEALNPLARLSGSTYAYLKDYFNIPRGVFDQKSLQR